MSVVEHLSTGSSNPPLVGGKLRLYSMRFCPYAQRVHLILNAKEVPHDVVYINLITKPEWYTKMIPTGKVPALVVKDTDLYESLIISDYLNEAYSTIPLYSNDPLKKAKDRILIESFGNVSGAMYKIYFTPNLEQKLLEDLVIAINPYEKEITARGTKYFGGNSPGMVDYMIWPWVERFDVLPLVTEPIFKIPEEKFPNLMKWKSLMIEDKAVKSHYLQPEQHAHHLKMRKAGTPDYVLI